jgi:hypothetical protein
MKALIGTTATTMFDLKNARRDIFEQLAHLMTNNNDNSDIKRRLQLLESVRDEAIRSKDEQSEKWKKKYDKKVRHSNLNVGDSVLWFDDTLGKHLGRKLESRWKGPFTITWKGNQGAYAIRLANETCRVVSGDKLRKYHCREPEI